MTPLLLVLAACDGPSPDVLFERDVVPALERSCASAQCHGVAPGAEAAGDVIDRQALYWDLDADGHIADVVAAREITRRAIDTTGDPDASSLLRKPLSPVYGGSPHYGGTNWQTPDDADYRAVWAWIAAEESGGEDAPPLDELERQFAEQVQPALLGMGCASGACHGPNSAVPYRLDPGFEGQVGDGATRRNYEATRSMLALGGDPRQSRLLRKVLPIDDGGIHHRGGNGAFLAGAGDARAAAIADWACAERLGRVSAPCEPELTGFVFVRGPLEPGSRFELDRFTPGTDLWLARLAPDGSVATTTNLTEHLHDAPADIRDPAVAPDGTAVLFAMRTSDSEGHRIYALNLRSLEHWPLSSGPGTDRDPTWGPDGTVWFTSTRAGVAADGGLLDADLYERLADGTERRRSWTPHVERKPHFLRVGEENGGEVLFTALRAAATGPAKAHGFRFPPGLATEYHQHFGFSAPEGLFWDTRELPDGNYVAVLGELDGAWGAGRLGIIDRNLGPELPDGAPPSLPNYLPPLSRLDPSASSGGTTGALYRDPAPLPDGRVLAAWAPGPVDLADSNSEPDTAIVRLTLQASPEGGTVLAGHEVLLDAPGVADFDPEPVYVSSLPQLTDPMSWTPGANTGRIHHQGAPMIDAINRSLAPTGSRPVRDDAVAVRVVLASQVPAQDFDRHTAGRQVPSTVLAELPLAADGTFQAELPAGRAVRLQLIDEAGMAVGADHNRWLDLHPGQTLPQGVSHDGPAYSNLCAPCHGSADGDPSHVHVPIDGLTGASLTLSRYEGQNPRRPIDPPLLGDDTRIGADFVGDVAPHLLGCIACHSGEAPAADLDLSDTPWGDWTTAYAELHASGAVGDGRARDSALMETLTGDELDAVGHPVQPGVRHGGLDDASIRAIARWIDVGAPFATELAP